MSSPRSVSGCVSPMPDAALLEFVLPALPQPPARLLEIGAGDGTLAEHLRGLGYDVVAIDPGGNAPGVDQVPLHELDAAPASFDGALAVVSLHHVEPLDKSLAHLASVVHPGGVLVVDEFDIHRFDMKTAEWWWQQRPDADGVPPDFGEKLAHMHGHLHSIETIVAALDPWFELSEPVRGPYLYRWKLGPEFRAVEEQAIAGGELAATGARTVGRRR